MQTDSLRIFLLAVEGFLVRYCVRLMPRFLNDTWLSFVVGFSFESAQARIEHNTLHYYTSTNLVSYVSYLAKSIVNTVGAVGAAVLRAGGGAHRGGGDWAAALAEAVARGEVYLDVDEAEDEAGHVERAAR